MHSVNNNVVRYRLLLARCETLGMREWLYLMHSPRSNIANSGTAIPLTFDSYCHEMQIIRQSDKFNTIRFCVIDISRPCIVCAPRLMYLTITTVYCECAVSHYSQYIINIFINVLNMYYVVHRCA